MLVLSCKEAAYKAGAGSAPQDIPLVMQGGLWSGQAVTASGLPESVVRWETLADSILAVAVLGPSDEAGSILEQLAARMPWGPLPRDPSVDSKRAIGKF